VDAAEAHGVSPADVALRWALQSTPPQAVIPRSSNEGRIRSNFENVARFELSASEMATIDALDGTATT
jgi:2,5-diketo-D-gluconate reductase A